MWTSLMLEQSHVSSAIEECIRTLAQKHLDVRFIKLHYQDAEMEPAGVPALIAYRGGDKFAGLVPVIDEIPDDADLSSLTLEMVMKRYIALINILTRPPSVSYKLTLLRLDTKSSDNIPRRTHRSSRHMVVISF